MKIQVISDVHMEFHADGGEEFVRLLAPDGIDALIVAGDLCAYSQIPQSLGRLCDRFENIVYVLGNHEAYGHSISESKEIAHAAAAKHSNLHLLDNCTAEICGMRFIGGTMWFHDDPENVFHERAMNDFKMIRGLREDVYAENRKTIRFFNKNMRKGDIVVTHHLPSMACVSRKYSSSEMNRFFVCSMDDLIFAALPKIWIHGHTHDSKDFEHGDTRIICNPFGYAMALNGGYIHNMTIDLPSSHKFGD